MTSVIKASIAEVKVGHLSLQGLLGADGLFYVAIPQVSEIFQFDKNQATRGLKSLMGKGFQFDIKAKTELHPKAVNILTIEQLEAVMVELAFKGNPVATQMVRDLVGLSLKQLFCDSFGIEFDLDARQEFLKFRQESKALFWDLTRQIETYISTHNCTAPEFTYYSNTFDALNMALFGKKSKAIREELCLTTGLNRDNFGITSLRYITTTQELASRLMKRDLNLKPIDAVKKAVEANCIEVGDYRK